jgi:FkbM family methyltransferase
MQVSYAQNFEDVMLWRALGHIERGLYIDLGAQDPVVDSVSLVFFNHGWHGIHVEPSARYAQSLRDQRPGDTVIQAAVADGNGVLSFFEIPDSGISTADPKIAEAHRARGFAAREIVVPRVRLSTIFEICEKRDIHWMKVDVEGYERNVLLSWGKSKARPWVVVIESTIPMTQIESHGSWESLLLRRGYEPIYFDGLNRYYVSDEKPELKAAFRAPPNVFDFDDLTINHTNNKVQLGIEIAKLRQNVEARKSEFEQSEVSHANGVAMLTAQAEDLRSRVGGLLQQAADREALAAQQLFELASEHTASSGQQRAEMQQLVGLIAAADAARVINEKSREQEIGGVRVELQNSRTEAERLRDLLNETRARSLADQKALVDRDALLVIEKERVARLEEENSERLTAMTKLETLVKAARLEVIAIESAARAQEKELEKQVREATDSATALSRVQLALRTELTQTNDTLSRNQEEQSKNQRMLENKIAELSARAASSDADLESARAVIQRLEANALRLRLDHHHLITQMKEAKSELMAAENHRHNLEQEFAQKREFLASEVIELTASLFSVQKQRQGRRRSPRSTGHLGAMGRFASIPPSIETHQRIQRAFFSSSQEGKRMDSQQFIRAIFQPQFVLSSDNNYELDDFLVLHDTSFVDACYRAILKREADPAGMDFYADRVRSGIGKVQIIEEICASAEAKAHGVHIGGLAEAIRFRWWCELPILGPVVSAASFLKHLPSHLQDLRALENHLFRSAEQLQSLMEINLNARHPKNK